MTVKTCDLLKFLRALDFIEKVTTREISPLPKGQINEEEFFALAGLWAGRDMTLDSIRQKAWPTRA